MPSARHRRIRSRSLTGPIAIGLIFAIAGLLFVASARLGTNREARGTANLREVVAAEKARQDDRAQQVAKLAAERDALLNNDSATSNNSSLPGLTDPSVLLASGAQPVRGPGVRVTLNDAPTGGVRAPGVRPDDLVVHQSDIEGVIDALWRGGAEAMAIQGQRLSSMSAVRCVGNVLLLHGQVYSPPYVIEAIGPTDAMIESLDTSGTVSEYRDWVERVGLGYSVEPTPDLEFGVYEGESTGLRYARTTPAD